MAMEVKEEIEISKSVAVIACTAMTFFYVAILYAPALLLRLPQPNSFKSFMLRRFISAAVSSIIFLILRAFILLWQAIVFPLSLTSLMYAGFLVLESLLLLDTWKEQWHHGGHPSFDSLKDVLGKSLIWMLSIGSNIMAWRSYIVVWTTPWTFVQHGCSQTNPPLMLGSSSKPFIGSSTKRQLTESFNGCRFSAWIHCRFLGPMPPFSSFEQGILLLRLFLILAILWDCLYLFAKDRMAFVAGMVGFVWVLFPLTCPYLYNYRTDNCECWH